MRVYCRIYTWIYLFCTKGDNFLMDIQQLFLNSLFDNTEFVVIADTPKGVKSFECNIAPQGVYFGINPVRPRTTRKNANVSQFRHFLVEFDGLCVSEQLDLMNKSRIPYLTAVFSGSKSVHFIIALESAVSSSEWRLLVQRLHLLFPGADKACKAGCQLSRLPLNPENWLNLGVGDEILGRKTTFEELDALLPKLPEKNTLRSGKTTRKILTKRASRYISGNASRCHGHADALHTAMTMVECGIDTAEILDTLVYCRMRDCEDSQETAESKARKMLTWALDNSNNDSL